MQQFDFKAWGRGANQPCLEKGRFLLSGCIYLSLPSFYNTYSLFSFFLSVKAIY